MSIKVTAANGMLVFEESSGSTFVVTSDSFQGLRTYKYFDHDTGDNKYAVKIFFSVDSQPPIIYNGYSTKDEADNEASTLIASYIEAKNNG